METRGQTFPEITLRDSQTYRQTALVRLAHSIRSERPISAPLMARVIFLILSWSAKALQPFETHSDAATAKHHCALMTSSGVATKSGAVRFSLRRLVVASS